jgi:hypothetical protein
MFICTSSSPVEKLNFRIRKNVQSLLGAKPTALPSDLTYLSKQSPYEVDYLGQKSIIDECLKSRVEHIVLLGCMGGNNFVFIYHV